MAMHCRTAGRADPVVDRMRKVTYFLERFGGESCLILGRGGSIPFVVGRCRVRSCYDWTDSMNDPLPTCDALLFLFRIHFPARWANPDAGKHSDIVFGLS